MTNFGMNTYQRIVKNYEEIKEKNSWFGEALKLAADMRKVKCRRKVRRNYEFIDPKNVSDKDFKRNFLFLNENSVSKDRVYKKLNDLYSIALDIKFFANSDDKKLFGENLSVFSKEIQDKILYRILSEENYIYLKKTSLMKIKRHFKKGKLTYLLN